MRAKKAFTMIELIFVIVILGILAAVAIPKLSATRGDALDAKDCKNTAICVTDLIGEYTAKGTATKAESGACTTAESSTENTITITITSSDVTIGGVPTRCNYLNRSYTFGGTRISL